MRHDLERESPPERGVWTCRRCDAQVIHCASAEEAQAKMGPCQAYPADADDTPNDDPYDPAP